MRKKHLALAICMAVASPATLQAESSSQELIGLNLGEIRSDSYLNQPFQGEIPILHTALDQAGLLKVSLAPKHVFDRIGIDHLPIFESLDFKVVSRQGRPVIQIRSQRPINVPFLNFVLEISGPKGVSYQDFTVLLDPPSYGRSSQDSFIDNEATTGDITRNSGSTNSIRALFQKGQLKETNDPLRTSHRVMSNPPDPQIDAVRNRRVEQQFLTHPLVKQVIDTLNSNVSDPIAAQPGKNLFTSPVGHSNYSAQELISISNQLSKLLDRQNVASDRRQMPSAPTESLQNQLSLTTVADVQGVIENMARDAVAQQRAQKNSRNELLQTVHVSPRLVTGGQTRYRVRPGDSLSLIAQKINTGNVSLTTMIRGLHQANPSAFVAGDINRLKAGVILTIPTVAELQQSNQLAGENSVRSRPASPNAKTIPASGKQAEQQTSAQSETAKSGFEAATYQVKRGDTLSSIVRKIGYKNTSFSKMLRAVYRSNPQAFVGRNINQLLAGAVLVLPDYEAVAGSTVAQTGLQSSKQGSVSKKAPVRPDSDMTANTTNKVEALLAIKPDSEQTTKIQGETALVVKSANELETGKATVAGHDPQKSKNTVKVNAVQLNERGESASLEPAESSRSGTSVSSGSNKTASAASEAMSVSDVAITTDSEAEYEVKVYTVKKGDTLAQIVQEVGDPSIPMMEMMKAIYSANPDAFEKSNITILKEGAMIRVPSRQEIYNANKQGRPANQSRTTETQQVTSKPSVKQESGSQPASTVAPLERVKKEIKQGDNTTTSEAADKSPVKDKTTTPAVPPKETLKPGANAKQSNPVVQQLEKRLRELRRDLINTRASMASLESAGLDNPAAKKQANQQDTNSVNPEQSEVLQTPDSLGTEERKEATLPVASLAPDFNDESFLQGMFDYVDELKSTGVESDSPVLAKVESLLDEAASSVAGTYNDKTMLYTTLALFLGLLLIRYRKRIYAYKPVSYEYPSYYPERRRKARLSDFDRKLRATGFFDVRQRLIDSAEAEEEMSGDFLQECEALLEDLQNLDAQDDKSGEANLDRVCNTYIEQFKKDLEVAKQSIREKDNVSDAGVDDSKQDALADESPSEINIDKNLDDPDTLTDQSSVADSYISDGLQIRSEDYKEMGRAVFLDDYSQVAQQQDEKETNSDDTKGHLNSETDSDNTEKPVVTLDQHHDVSFELNKGDNPDQDESADVEDAAETVKKVPSEQRSTGKLSFEEFERLGELNTESSNKAKHPTDKPDTLQSKHSQDNNTFAELDQTMTLLEQADEAALNDTEEKDALIDFDVHTEHEDKLMGSGTDASQSGFVEQTDESFETEPTFFELNLDDGLAFDEHYVEKVKDSDVSNKAEISLSVPPEMAFSPSEQPGEQRNSDQSSVEAVSIGENGSEESELFELDWEAFLNKKSEQQGVTEEASQVVKSVASTEITEPGWQIGKQCGEKSREELKEVQDTGISATSNQPQSGLENQAAEHEETVSAVKAVKAVIETSSVNSEIRSEPSSDALEILRNETYLERHPVFKTAEAGQLDLLSATKPIEIRPDYESSETADNLSDSQSDYENSQLIPDAWMADIFSYEEYSRLVQTENEKKTTLVE